jgi:uncharacterized repeat protein (TIGR03803 family)
VFKITPAGTETVLHSFAGTSDGGKPAGALIQGSDGNFYGTTFTGGAGSQGTVYKITPTGIETVLYSFSGATDGNQPQAALIEGSDGNFYGTAYSGGMYGGGMIFGISPAGIETTHYSLGFNMDARYPGSALVLGADGNFYGTTNYGGTNNFGAIFKFGL